MWFQCFRIRTLSWYQCTAFELYFRTISTFKTDSKCIRTQRKHSPGNTGVYCPEINQSECVVSGQYEPVGNNIPNWLLVLSFLIALYCWNALIALFFFLTVCVMLFSTRRIVRGEAIWPFLKKTKKVDRWKNLRGFRSRQFINKNAIASELNHFWRS